MSFLVEQIRKVIENPTRPLHKLMCYIPMPFLSDKIYLKFFYRFATQKQLRLNPPVTFNEKLQWLKLYDRRPEYTIMADKYAVRQYIKDTIGERYLIPLYGVWDNPDDIDFNALPNQFVLKCNHDSGSIIVCKDKTKFDFDAAKKKLGKCLKKNYFWISREWCYKNIKPCIIAEKYMVDESGMELKDYKIFNFNGKAKIVDVHFDRFKSHKRNIYTTEWEYIDVELSYPNEPTKMINKPDGLKEMIAFSEKLSVGIPFVRTDFYSINDKIYFGEMTFYTSGGVGTFKPESFDLQLGEWIELPVKESCIR